MAHGPSPEGREGGGYSPPVSQHSWTECKDWADFKLTLLPALF
jgi:hypothetical protein